MVGEWCTKAAGAVQTRHTVSPGAVGLRENLRMGATPSPRAAVTTTNAQTQRHRSLGDDAENRLATLFTAGALVIRRCDSPQAQSKGFSGLLESKFF